MSESEFQDENIEASEVHQCNCETELEEEVKELRRQVVELRTDIDFLIERRGIEELLEEHKRDLEEDVMRR